MFQKAKTNEMSNGGKYVRAPKDFDPEWSPDTDIQADCKTTNSMTSVREVPIPEM